MITNTIIFDKNAEKIIRILNKKGFSAYYVGGCVRDALLGNEPHDFDIASSALPEECCAIFREEGYNVAETGLKHGTVTVIIEHKPYEVTTFRTDGVYSDNRRPESVTFVRSLKEDLARRDFTVNALAFHPDEGVIDYFGGQADISHKIIRCVGVPEKRFEEDALRILRALRFAARLGFEIEEKTAAAVKSRKELLRNISAERIYAELCGILCADKPAFVIREYVDVFGVFIPEILPTVNFAQNSRWHIYDVFNHTVTALDNTPNDLVVRLAVLLHDLGKPLTYTQDKEGFGHFKGHQKVSFELAERIMRRLTADKKTTESVCSLVLHHDDRIPVEEAAVMRLIRRMGREDAIRAVYVEMADNMAQNPEMVAARTADLKIIEKMVREMLASSDACITVKNLAVTGNDVILSGVPKGPQVGRILEFLLDEVTEKRLPNEKEALMDFIKLYKDTI